MRLAYCGDDCSICPRYNATLDGSEEALKKVAELMVRVGWNEEKVKDPEKLKCRGCQDIENCEYGVKECCLERKIVNCGECSDYPCPQIEKAFEITNGYAVKFRDILSKEEYKMFHQAYFLKKENLDNINKK